MAAAAAASPGTAREAAEADADALQYAVRVARHANPFYEPVDLTPLTSARQAAAAAAAGAAAAASGAAGAASAATAATAALREGILATALLAPPDQAGIASARLVFSWPSGWKGVRLIKPKKTTQQQQGGGAAAAGAAGGAGAAAAASGPSPPTSGGPSSLLDDPDSPARLQLVCLCRDDPATDFRGQWPLSPRVVLNGLRLSLEALGVPSEMQAPLQRPSSSAPPADLTDAFLARKELSRKPTAPPPQQQGGAAAAGAAAGGATVMTTATTKPPPTPPPPRVVVDVTAYLPGRGSGGGYGGGIGGTRGFVLALRLVRRVGVERVAASVRPAPLLAEAVDRLRRDVFGAAAVNDGGNAAAEDEDEDDDEDDDDVRVDSVTVNLRCTLTARRLQIPVRFSEAPPPALPPAAAASFSALSPVQREARRRALTASSSGSGALVVYDRDGLLEAAQRSGTFVCAVTMRPHTLRDVLADPFVGAVVGALAALGARGGARARTRSCAPCP